ncbi:S9 family peptidase [Myxococcota bacterium]|nr:S9 family peptidase [Myxococcota bacterium]MBU1535978.1 S9 family peptidase [Myxococcota bacterium]
MAVLILAGCTCPGKCPSGGQGSCEKPAPVKTTAAPVPLPVTVAPSKQAPRATAALYDPEKDPANKDSYPLVRARSADDPLDAKKKPFGIEALYKLIEISSPTFSPDGTKILFNKVTRDLSKGTSQYTIYLMDHHGKNQRALTDASKASYSFHWAPDSSRFLFISAREKGEQVWIMDLRGGDPEKITDISTGVSEARFTADSKSILFVSKVFPSCGADDKKNKALLDDRKKSSIKAHMADSLLYRHWTSYKDGLRSHIMKVDLATREVTDLSPGDFDSPAFALGGVGYGSDPDSKELCFVSNREAPDARAYTTNKDLFVVPLTGGKPLNITASNKAFDGEPTYSPTGTHIAFFMQKVPGFESDKTRLAVYERSTGKITILTEGFDDTIYDYRWEKDGKSIVFMAPRKGRYPLFRVELASGKIFRVGQIPSVGSFDVSSRGEILFTFGRIGTPKELYLRTTEGKIRRLTGFNDQLVKEYDIRPAEEMWIPGADGKKVHTFVVKPHGFVKGKKYPLIINVHGGPQMQWADYLRGDWQVYPAHGYVVAFPNPHGSTGYGQKYTDAISKDWGGKVYQDVMAVTEALAKLPCVDEKRMGAMGWSYGGYMMNWLLGHTTRFNALVSMMGVYDLASKYGVTEELWFPEWDVGGTPWDNPGAYKKWSPSSYASKFATPTMVITGEKDYRVSYTQSLQLFTALRRRGVPSKLIVFPNDGHWPSYVKSMPLYYAAHLMWFHKYLGGRKAPWKLQDMIDGRAFSPQVKQPQGLTGR